MIDIDYALVRESLSGTEDECGDTGMIRKQDDVLFLALVDVLGHGREAHKIACMADEYIADHFQEELTELMNGLHTHLRGTRGAVAGFCRLYIPDGTLYFTGIGNITTRIYGENSHTLVPRDGIIGFSIPVPEKQKTVIKSNELLILSSDGIKEHFRREDYPGLLEGSSETIARSLIRLLKKNDDASCIVLRYGI